MFDGWATELKQQRPDLDDASLTAFREQMYGGDFVFSVSRDFLKSVRTPLLLLYGSDRAHPRGVSIEVAGLLPNAETIERWREPDVVPAVTDRIRAFLKAQSTANASA